MLMLQLHIAGMFRRKNDCLPLKPVQTVLCRAYFVNSIY